METWRALPCTPNFSLWKIGKYCLAQGPHLGVITLAFYQPMLPWPTEGNTMKQAQASQWLSASSAFLISECYSGWQRSSPHWHLFKGSGPVRSSHFLPGVCSTSGLFVWSTFHSSTRPKLLLNVSHWTESSQHRILWKVGLHNFILK